MTVKRILTPEELERRQRDAGPDLYYALGLLLAENEINPTGIKALEAANHARKLIEKVRGE